MLITTKEVLRDLKSQKKIVDRKIVHNIDKLEELVANLKGSWDADYAADISARTAIVASCIGEAEAINARIDYYTSLEELDED